MVSQPFSGDVVRKAWLLGGLMRALAGRRIESVEFVGGNIHHQHVRWEGGGDVWVNRGEADWTGAGGHSLPAYGFFASVPGPKGTVHQAAIERSGNTVSEWSKHGPESYMNSRGRGIGYRWREQGVSAVITPLPESEPGVLTLPQNPGFGLAQVKQVAALDARGQQIKTTKLETENGRMLLRHESGVFAYRIDFAPGKK